MITGKAITYRQLRDAIDVLLKDGRRQPNEPVRFTLTDGSRSGYFSEIIDGDMEETICTGTAEVKLPEPKLQL